MIFRETGPYSTSYKSGYPTQYSNIQPFSHNEAVTINKIIRPIMVSLFEVDLTEEFITPNCVAPCNYLNEVNFKLTYNSGTVEANIHPGICIIHEVTVEIQSKSTCNLNLSDNWFDSKPTSPEGQSKVWAAVRLIIDKTDPLINGGQATVGFFSDLDNYEADSGDYCLIGYFLITITSGVITSIDDVGYLDDTHPELGRSISLVDDGWLTPIPTNFVM